MLQTSAEMTEMAAMALPRAGVRTLCRPMEPNTHEDKQALATERAAANTMALTIVKPMKQY